MKEQTSINTNRQITFAERVKDGELMREGGRTRTRKQRKCNKGELLNRKDLKYAMREESKEMSYGSLDQR